MGMFSRLSDIINSNINAMLDRAEDPEKIARLIIQEMEDTLVEVRAGAARALADKKELERDVVMLEASREDWRAKAELAVEKGREDLARGALAAKQRAEREIDDRLRALKTIEDVSVRRQEDLGKLQEKIQEAKARYRQLVIRREAAEQRLAMRSHMDVNKIDYAMERYARVERKVDEMESMADLINTGERSLEAQFRDMAEQESIDLELAEIKRRHGVEPAPAAQASRKQPEGGDA